jgi:signal transduction histidine kinase
MIDFDNRATDAQQMKILGEDLGEAGRWYLALPPLLLIGFLVGLFLVAAAGQSRLEAANERVHASQLRQQALSEYIALITGAETAQRGYLLTGKSSYLQPYLDALPKIQPALNRIHQAYASAGTGSDKTSDLKILTGKKLGELEDTLALFRERGPAQALDIVRTDLGKQTMDDISRIVGAMRLQENAELSAATDRWRFDLRLSRWLTSAGVVSNIGLVLLAMSLGYADMRRRALQARELRDQKHHLERQVAERTHELAALSTHLQYVSEQEKHSLSRELHDELGGLLVAARMDLSWLQQRLPTSDPAIEQRFRRIHESLSAGVDLKRRVVEELRPTLLDNMGLYSALQWQFKETCRRSGLKCTENIPKAEHKFSPEAAIGIFRIAQEAFTNILKHAVAKSADMTIEVNHEEFVLRISDDGRGISGERIQTATSHGLVSMRHRITALGGKLEMRTPAAGGTVVTVHIPVSRIMLSEPA